MTYLVKRTCTEVVQPSGEKISRPIEDLRGRGAYVLLGDPGSGKTEAFKAEAKACAGFYVTARNFLALSFPTSAQGKTIFIDGLDESRAGEGDGRTPLDRIRRQLDKLDRPSFRLSCREADWLGASDREALAAIAPAEELSVIHLDQLTRDQIRDILAHSPFITDPDVFLKNAEEKGLDALLQNPQTLNLLIEAVKGNEWPSTRQETFRLACEKLAAEPNPEHRTVSRGHYVNTADLLHAAGGLSAIQLIADISGFTESGETRQDIFALRDIGCLDGLPVSQALKTRIFVGIGEEQFAPVHRSVAEYLAARFLMQVIEKNNLPAGRVLALMTAADGGIVAGLRGLNAWLSVHHPETRRRLIQIDPLGVVLYGDIKLFSVDDKLAILRALHDLARQYAGFRWQDWSDKPFGALATPDMLDHLKVMLASPCRDESYQVFLDCVLDAIRYGDPLPQLKSELRAAISDTTRWPMIRRNALTAFIQVSRSDTNELRQIAEDIRDGKIEDPDDGMLGELLDELFPNTIKAQDVFSYLHKQKDDHLVGTYHMFWSHTLSKAANNDDIPILMDKLSKEELPVLDDHTEFAVRKMLGDLLCRAVIEYGEKVKDEQLYEWLGTALNNYDHPRIEHDDSTPIKDWLTVHPERYRGLLSVGIGKCASAENFRSCIYKIAARFFGTKPPDNLGLWWLDRAEAEQDQVKADCLFDEAIGHLFSNEAAAGLSIEFLEKWVEESPRFASAYQRRNHCEIQDWQREDAELTRKYKEEQQKKRDEWTQHFREHLSSIRAGDAHPEILHNLAIVYLGKVIEARGETGLARLQNFLAGDEELISAALEGFRRSIERSDLPSVDKILALDVKGHMHFIRQACIAGLEERYRADPSQVLDLSDEVLEKAVAFQYTSWSDEKDWFKACIRNRPDVVAKVLTKYLIMQMKAKKEHIIGIHHLVYDKEYESVARHAITPLLRAFPSRARKMYVSSVLGDSLKAALRYMDNEELKSIINQKLTLSRMDSTQRVFWLAAGFVIDACQYKDALKTFIGEKCSRIESLASFFNNRFDHWIIRQEMPESGLSCLIKILAPKCSPEWPRGQHWVSQSMQTTEFTRGLANRLAATPTKAAAEEIQHLLQDSSLSSWHKTLRHALHTQRFSFREATFLHPTVWEVCDTLSNSSPANAADLAALTTELLRDLANEIRHGNTDQYKQFWNVDQHARPTKPRPEDACRDSLLERLKDRLRRFGVEAIPEAHYANDKRADIRVSYTTSNLSMAIPIEIKRDSHHDLWTAISDQLIDLYTREPESKGRGIFLAFWFGGKNMPAPPKKDKPTSAAELETLLNDIVPADKKELISVCVVDCSLTRNK